MSRSLPQLQQQASERAGEFCARYVKPRRRTGRTAGRCGTDDSPARRPQPKPGGFYRPRDHEASPLFQVVRDCFDEFERVYPERYQKAYGYWRPVVHTSVDKFLKCGDLKEGFARVRCPDCGKELSLKCTNCGGTMRIVALIDRDRQADVVEKILRHCRLWKEPNQRAPPETPVAEPQPRELTYDPGYFDRKSI